MAGPNETLRSDEQPGTQREIPRQYLLSREEALPYNPFLSYASVPSTEIRPHEKGKPWLTPDDLVDLIGVKPDAIACYTGAIKQPRAYKDEGDTTEKLRPPLVNRDYHYGPASFAYGEDPYRPNIMGTGGKVNVIGTKHVAQTLPDIPIFTFATFSNENERRMNREQGMPTAAQIYKHELQELHKVKNEIRAIDDQDVENSLEMIVANIIAMAKDPKIKNCLILTEHYHIPRCKAFLDLCGMGEGVGIQKWIFENWEKRSHKHILTDEFIKSVKDLKARGAKMIVTGGEDIMTAVDNKRIQAGRRPGYHSLLSHVYPPRLSMEQYQQMTPEQQQDWLQCFDNLQARLDIEAKGVEQLKNGTYWKPKEK